MDSKVNKKQRKADAEDKLQAQRKEMDKAKARHTPSRRFIFSRDNNRFRMP